MRCQTYLEPLEGILKGPAGTRPCTLKGVGNMEAGLFVIMVLEGISVLRRRPECSEWAS